MKIILEINIDLLSEFTLVYNNTNKDKIETPNIICHDNLL